MVNETIEMEFKFIFEQSLLMYSLALEEAIKEGYTVCLDSAKCPSAMPYGYQTALERVVVSQVIPVVKPVGRPPKEAK